MAKLLIIFTYLIFTYLLIVIIIFCFQRSLLYFPSKEKVDQSYYTNTGLKEVKIETSDGLLLNSLFVRPSSKNQKTILVFHGNAGHVGHRVNKFKSFIDKGFGLLLLEYRGFSKNQGKPSEKGFYEDGLAALNFLSKQKISSMETIIYGESLGCGVAVKLSTENNFYATILEAPYTSISDVAQKHYWYLPAKWLVLDRFDALGIIKKIRSPLLIIHGSKDNVISINFGKKLFNAAPEPKKSLFIKDAGHNNLFEFNIYKSIFSFLENISYTN